MKKLCFASDFHLGIENRFENRKRESTIIEWLNTFEDRFDVLFLVGDIFDFWFEYKHVIPKGHTRFLAKIAQLIEKGKEVHFFVGNHDLWMFDYLEEELGVIIHHQPFYYQIENKTFLIGHGDGLGPGDNGYKRMKKIFKNRFCQWLFRWLHPDIGIRIASYSSMRSRASQKEPEIFLGSDKEWLNIYAEQKLKDQPEIDYFIFGHRHLPMDILLSNQKSRYFNLGDWIKFNTFLLFDGRDCEMHAYKNNNFNAAQIKY